MLSIHTPAAAAMVVPEFGIARYCKRTHGLLVIAKGMLIIRGRLAKDTDGAVLVDNAVLVTAEPYTRDTP